MTTDLYTEKQPIRWLVGVLGFLLALTTLVDRVCAATTYHQHVSKVLKSHCVGCHNANRPRAGLDLSSYESILKGSSLGDVVVAGDVDESLLYLVSAHEEEPAMPPGGKKIPDDDLEVLRVWIEEGLLRDAEPVVDESNVSVATQPAGDAKSISAASSADSLASVPGLVFRGPHQNPVKAIAISETLGVFVVGGELQVLVFDLSTNSLVNTLPFPEGEVEVLRFSIDGTKLLAAGGVPAESGGIVVWDVVTSKRQWHRHFGDDAVLAADFLKGETTTVSGGPDRLATLFDPRTNQVVHKLDKHTDWLLAARSGPGRLIFATGDRDGGLYAWEAESGTPIHTLRGHNGAITAIEYFASGDEWVTASEDGTIRIWDMHSGKSVTDWVAHKGGVRSISIGIDQLIASVGRDNHYRLWDRSGKLVQERGPVDSLPTAIATMAGQSIVGHHNGEVVVWKYADAIASRLTIPSEFVTSDPSLLLSTIKDVELQVFGNKMTLTEDVGPTIPEGGKANTKLEASDVLSRAASLQQRIKAEVDTLSEFSSEVQSLRNSIIEMQQQLADLQQRKEQLLNDVRESTNSTSEKYSTRKRDIEFALDHLTKAREALNDEVAAERQAQQLVELAIERAQESAKRLEEDRRFSTTDAFRVAEPSPAAEIEVQIRRNTAEIESLEAQLEDLSQEFDEMMNSGTDQE